jgi:pimeloyl-ACP methyl ester carboxylesterase
MDLVNLMLWPSSPDRLSTLAKNAHTQSMTNEATLHHFPGHDGAKIAVHRLGAGRPVLFIHGLASNVRTNWLRYGTAQRVADAGFEAIMVDLRVHGQSDAPHDPAAYPPDVAVLDIEAVIGALDLSAFDLVGYSLGSRLSAMLVARGHRPRRLVLGGMGLRGFVDWRPRRQFYLDAIERFDIARPGEPDFLAIQFMKTTKIDPIALKYLLLSLDDIPREDLDALTMETLVLYGEKDDDPGSADALAAALPRATRITVPGTHMSCITLPEFGAAIADYLAA